jgi:hypothetical protein
MHKFLTALLFLAGLAGHAQIKGKVTEANGTPIPFVSVAIENTYTGTTANDEGLYELPFKDKGRYTLVFQSIGFKTKKIPVNITAFPFTQDVVLEDETYQLNELVISKGGEDPAYAIMRQAIDHRKENSAKAGRFEADFYSKAIFRVKNVPKKIMGMDTDPDKLLDSTGSGIIYLSETVSRITFEQPNNLKERIIGSKVSGDNNGFSFNTAHGTFYNFYDDYVDFDEIKMVSPLAKSAFSYYKFKLEGSFFDDYNNHINKIQVIAKRDKEPVFEGYIYIIDQSWEIYAVDVDIKGYRIQQPILKNLNLQQNFSYNENNKLWSKNSQTFNLDAGMLGISFNGKITHVYTNYVFHDAFAAGTFGDEIGSYEKNSNKKDSVYWNAVRPVPLSTEEVTDYVIKDSISAKYENPVYKDSIQRARNKFHLTDVLTGYSYTKSDKKIYTNAKYDGILQLPMYNTVQGWNAETALGYTYSNSTDSLRRKYTSASATFNYGLAEERLRVRGSLTHTFGNVGTVFLSGGNSIEQFNPANPITPLINSVSTLFFKDNYMKLYDKQFASIYYSKSPFKFLALTYGVEYLRRRPLYNNADWVMISRDHDYTSNNPLEPENNFSVPFEKHTLYRASIAGSVVFGERGKYITYPNGGKYYVERTNYPRLSFAYQQAFAGSKSQYEYSVLSGAASWSETFSNKGDFAINIKGGKFFNADGIAFTDYKHFNGNQTHVNDGGTYNNVFNMLPYYSLSTNNAYFELHAEHNDKGFLMNKVPLLSALQWNLVVGYHQISTPDYKPYREVSVGFDNIGIGAFRMLRVDYVRAYQGSGFVTDGVVFGLKFLDVLD